MTTNLEWMYENDRETLISMITGDCGNCKFDSNCYAGDYRCTHRWLEAEYEEPDSWEKIEYRAALDMINYCRTILKWDEIKIWSSTYHQMHNAVVEDIINRCKAVAEAESLSFLDEL